MVEVNLPPLRALAVDLSPDVKTQPAPLAIRWPVQDEHVILWSDCGILIAMTDFF